MDTKTTGNIGVSEAARILGVTSRTIHRYIAKGELTAEKMGQASSAYILNRAEVEAKAAING